MIEIGSLDKLQVISGKDVFPEDIILLNGSVSEIDLIDFLKTNKFTYERVGFKKWQISKRKINKNAVTLRICILISALILLSGLIYTLVIKICGTWQTLEVFYGKYQLLIGIGSFAFTALLSKFLAYKYKSVLNQYLYG